MIKIKKVDRENIQELINKYYKNIHVPLDDIWENMILDGDFYTVHNKELLGYFVSDDKNTLLQFSLNDAYENYASEIFDQLLNEQDIKGAVAGTFEPGYLSLCLDKNSKVEVDTFLYKESKNVEIKAPMDFIKIETAAIEELSEVLDFTRNKGGYDGDWLEGYYQNLLPKKCIYLFKTGEEIIGIGSLRPSLSNPSYVNLGLMVSTKFRRKNLGTYIMSQLRILAKKKGKKAICSTTIDNIGSQKAIKRSGFHAYHRILKIKFKTDKS